MEIIQSKKIFEKYNRRGFVRIREIVHFLRGSKSNQSIKSSEEEKFK